MADLILPHFAAGSGHEIIIDGVTYKVPLIDAAGRVCTNAYATGASEVKAIIKETADPSTTRITIATPASGKKIRLVSHQLCSRSDTVTTFEVYFGTGIHILIDGSKAVFRGVLDLVDLPTVTMVWPDGGGPVGAVDEVISLRTSANITSLGSCVIHYREE